MVDNLNRKLTLVIGALVVAVIALLLLPFRLGLDLQGGTRLVYSVDLDAARAEGLIPENQTNTQAIGEIMDVWRKRVDPTGVRAVKMRKEGEESIVIELPGSASAVAKKANGTLGADYNPTAENPVFELTSLEQAKDFPSTGGRIQVGGSSLRYKRRFATQLEGITFGDNEEVKVIPSGTALKLEASDPWRARIENTGRMEVMMHAQDSDLRGAAGAPAVADLAEEMVKAKAWLTANPNAGIREYNLQLETQNPDTALGRLRFFPRQRRSDSAESTPIADRLVAVIVEDKPRWHFSGADFKRVFSTYDESGFPAVGFDIAVNRYEDFGSFTEVHSEQKEQMAIIVDDEIVTDPTLNTPLYRGGQITGGAFGFTQEEVDLLVSSINSGSLNVEPRFEDRETVGASLGQEYVTKGKISVIAGLLAVLVFVSLYYKRLGVLAAISLIFNLVLLMGAMAVLQATLTLPGVAGIILTVGMAVDANILIYERIREEALRGRRPAQSAKDGFSNALSTIVDANLTTLITAVILYKFGSGAVQGFATTLIVGILSSMFSALVFTRVLVHFALEKGVDEWKMMRLVQDTNIPFMAIAKKTAIVSVIAIVAGVTWFASIPKVEKFSIDFVGGNSMQVVTAKAQTQDTIAGELAKLGGVFVDAQVQPLLSSGEDEGYRKFQIEFKALNATDAQASQTYRAQVETGLASLLSPNRFTFESTGAEGAKGKVYFEDSHQSADVEGILDGAGLGDVTLETVDGGESGKTFSFASATTKSQNDIEQAIAGAFELKKDSGGRAFTLSQPVPQSSSVGPQVVRKLRDDAILAILLSLFAVVMYIRIRFAEYSYGFAAVIALVHDVLVTLGFLALAISVGWINAQVSLVMIAAFLTIIGYSLNDTIVVFDRIRENLRPLSGKMALGDIIDKSINQTLARTVLTSLTTLITVLILFAFNVGSRNELEGFAYAVIVGVFVGTYSSMFIASPALLWLENRRGDRPETESEAVEADPKPASITS